MTDNAKEKIADAIKAIEKSVEEMKLLQEYNFNNSKYRLLEAGHRLVSASSDILRSASDLEDNESK